MPPNTVYVGRPSMWGNPYDWKEYGREQAVSMFEYYYRGKEYQTDAILALKGKNLACWCPPDQPCHADILLKIANQ